MTTLKLANALGHVKLSEAEHAIVSTVGEYVEGSSSKEIAFELVRILREDRTELTETVNDLRRATADLNATVGDMRASFAKANAVNESEIKNLCNRVTKLEKSGSVEGERLFKIVMALIAIISTIVAVVMGISK